MPEDGRKNDGRRRSHGVLIGVAALLCVILGVVLAHMPFYTGWRDEQRALHLLGTYQKSMAPLDSARCPDKIDGASRRRPPY